MFSIDGSPILTNCTFTNNSSSSGGGIYCESSSYPTISGSSICGNTPDQISGSYNDAGGNNVADECPVNENCPADTDGSGAVDITDLLAVIHGWGTDSSDINGDGATDVLDVLAVIDGWGLCD